MKKGFTMIELIFVIVILGILAAVAIPRLAATRDDAEIAKVSTNLTTLLSDVGAYYTSQGSFASDLKQMTNVQLEGTGKTGELTAAGKKCLKVTLTEAAGGKPAVIKVEKGTDADSDKAPICKSLIAVKGIEEILTGTFKYTDAKGAEQTSGVGEVAISGISVVR